MKVADLSNVESTEPSVTLVAPGDYTVIVTDAEEGQSKTGTPCIALTMEVVSDGEYKGRGLRDWVYITPKAIWRVRQCLEAFGFQIPEGEFDFDPAALISQQAEVTVAHRVWENKPQTDIKEYRRLSEDDKVEVPVGDDGIPF